MDFYHCQLKFLIYLFLSLAFHLNLLPFLTLTCLLLYYLVILIILYFIIPSGTCTSTISPVFPPNKAPPTGDSLEIFPLYGSASAEPTITYSIVSSNSISSTS